MVRIFWFLSVLLMDTIIIQHNYGLPMEGSVAVNQDGSENFFDEFVAPIVKYGMMSSGNKTETEADSVLNVISTAVKNRAAAKSAKSDSVVKGGGSDVSKKDTFFQDYVAPIIRYGMMNAGNATETEADAILGIFSPEMEKSTTSETSAPTNPFKSGSFFQDYIVPVIRHGMITSGNKTEAEADAILDIITTAIKNRTAPSSSDTEEQNESGADASSSRLFSDYIAPIIRFGLLESGTKTESSDAPITDTISSLVKNNNENSSPETENALQTPAATSDDNPAANSESYFERFIAPIIKHGMMTTGNKTESEADALLNIIISSKKNKTSTKPLDMMSSFPSETTADNTKPGSFFQSYIAPMLKYKMTTTGNKTEEEADTILNAVSSSMKTAAAYSTDTDPSTSASFFQDFISPIIRHGILSFGNKTEIEADAILDKISSDIKSRAAMTASEKTIQQDTSSTVDDTPAKSVAFFQKFIAPMIRYGMINSGNKTEEEADAILNIISAGQSTSSEKTEETKGSFFLDFVAPLIRNRMMTSDMKNESETDSIMTVITTAVKNKESAKTSNSEIENESKFSADPSDKESDQEIDTVVKDLIMPEINDVISKATSSDDTDSEDDASEIVVARKEAAEQIKDDILGIFDSGRESSVDSGRDSSVDSGRDSSVDSGRDTSVDSGRKTSSEEKSTPDDGNDNSLDERNAPDSASESDEVNAETNTVDSLVDNYLTPALSEKIQNLKKLANFFSDPTVFSGLRESFQDVVKTIHESDTAERISSSGDANQPDNPVDTDTPTNPLHWFMGRVVTPEIQKQMARFGHFTNDIPTVNAATLPESTKTALSKVRSLFPNYRHAEEKEKEEEEEEEGQRDSSSQRTGVTFFKDVIVPGLKKEAKKFKTIAAKFSTADGRKAISGAVEKFVDKTMSLRSKLAEFRRSKYEKYYKGYKTRVSKRSAGSDTIQQESVSSETADGFVDEVVMPAIEKKAKIMKAIAGKFENPEKVDEIINVVKNRIKTMVERKRNALCGEKACEEKIMKAKAYDILHGRNYPSSQWDSEKSDIVKQIVQLKMKIAKDRMQSHELEKQIDTPGSYDEKIKLISAQSKIIQNIKESAMALQESFRNLRSEKSIPYRQSLNMNTDSWKNNDDEGQNYTENVEKTVEQINKLTQEISDYGPKIAEVGRKLNLEYIYSNRLALESEKFELIGELKSKTIKLNNLYGQLRYDQAAMKKKEFEQEETPGMKHTFETDFTDEEIAEYAGLLGELNYAADTDRDEDVGSGSNTTVLIVGLTVAVTGTVVLGLVVFKRRNGKHRLYKRIPNENTLGTKFLVSGTDSYGSCTNSP